MLPLASHKKTCLLYKFCFMVYIIQVVDSALSTDSENEEMSLELVGKPEGYKTAKFLFNFGAVCLER